MDETMIERIERDGVLYAIIIRHNYEPEETTFFTSKDSSLQFGITKHEEGYTEKPHVHNRVKKVIYEVHETLHLVQGKAVFDFYTEAGEKVSTVILDKGDTVLLANGAHAMSVLKDCWGVKVKQGPYGSIEEDKQTVEVKNDTSL